MKKLFILFSILLLITGCGKNNEEKLINKFSGDVNSSKSYKLNGSLEILNDEDTFNYAIEVLYKKKDMYRVKLTNTVNNHEQIILRNNEAVYVITPSLNKSFKFQSEWPYNSSQSYLLGSILDDLKNTGDRKYSEESEYLVLQSDVNYPNNSDLVYQKLYFDKDYNLKKNEVYNIDNQVRIRFVVGSIDYKANLDDKEFEVEANIDENCCKDTNDKESSSLNDIIYPLYIPSETYLKTKETISTDNGNRAILTFSGAKDFVLIEEASTYNKEFLSIPIYGDPIMMNGSVAALSGNSLYWTMNNVDYYLSGSDLSNEELLSVASSISNTIVTSK